MKELLYKIVEYIAKIHNYLLRLNDANEYNFTDKELHFLVVGIMGMAFIFVVYPIFKWLAKRDHVMVIAWIYVFTLIIVITFAIEIGQKVTNTGNMEFADIMMGVMGFVVMFVIFSIIREIYKGIRSTRNAVCGLQPREPPGGNRRDTQPEMVHRHTVPSRVQQRSLPS